VVTVEFNRFQTNKASDFVSLFDGDTLDFHIGSYSGFDTKDGPGFVRTFSNQMVIYFHSDPRQHNDQGDEGWNAHYKMACASDLAPQLSCPSLVKESISRRTMLNFSSAHYVSGVDCSWVVSNRENNCEHPIVGIDFSHFNTESFFDYVTLYDGASAEATVIGTFSGTAPWEAPLFQRSSGPHMYVEFHSDATLSGANRGLSGFMASFESMCKGDPTPKSSYVCSEGNGETIVHIDSDRTVYKSDMNSQGALLPLLYGHRALPMTLGSPVVIHHNFSSVVSPALITSESYPDGLFASIVFASDVSAI
jgi:hypothetical protein